MLLGVQTTFTFFTDDFVFIYYIRLMKIYT